jgi:hypothetical protein
MMARAETMHRQETPLEWLVPQAVTLDALVDAEQLTAAVARLGGAWRERGPEDPLPTAVLLADCGQLGVMAEAGEECCWQQLPARVVRSGQARVQLRRLALLAGVIMPGVVRVFVEGPLLNVIGTAGQPLSWRACVRVEEEALPKASRQ